MGSPGLRLPQEEAERLLPEELARFQHAVSTLVALPLNEAQFAAPVSVAFTVGEGR